jgi:hypothetical protein
MGNDFSANAIETRIATSPRSSAATATWPSAWSSKAGPAYLMSELGTAHPRQLICHPNE